MKLGATGFSSVAFVMVAALAVAVSGRVFAAAGPAAGAGGLKPIVACVPGKAPGATVAGVVDGATLALSDGRTIALAGIEAPLPPLSSPDARSPLSEAARAALAAIVPMGAMVRVALAGDKPDRYGRYRANVFTADGQSLAALAVAAGYARVHRLPGDPDCVVALLDVERGARVARRGMWGDADYRIRSADDLSLGSESGLYELVAGRILSVGSGDVTTFLNFGRDYSRDFTVMVAPAVARDLAAAGIDLNALAGKRVVVRGMIEASGGPEIRLGAATDIEVIGDGDDE